MSDLQKAWDERCKLWAKGDKLQDEGDKLRAEGYKLWAKGDKLQDDGYKLRADGYKLWADGNKLRTEGDLLFINAAIEKHGPEVVIEWTGDGAIVNGEEFTYNMGGKHDRNP